MATETSVNPDLTKERKSASFDPNELTYVLDAGINNTRRRRYITKLIRDDPVFQCSESCTQSRQEAFLTKLRHQVALVLKLQRMGIDDPGDINLANDLVLENEHGPMSLHNLAFKSAFILQADEEQKRVWLPRMNRYEVIGCYAQTEMGHGSFVRGLETESVYDPRTQEFVLNSPTLTATKYWVGNLGVVCTHAVIIAQLYTKGQKRGVHPFLMQIRSLDNHVLLPGIEAGDIGPKMGAMWVDNGYMRLTNVRISKDSLLGKTGKVSTDGTYSPPENPMLVYSGMLGIRVDLPMGSAKGLSRACTIAIRYSCVRKQSEMIPGQPEPPVLDYQTQQHKLFPHLAAAYGTLFAAQALVQLYQNIQQQVDMADFTRLNELHATSAVLKTVIAWKSHRGAEVLRLSCGGHGYSMASGLPQIYNREISVSTAEGEHSLLLLQTARYLVKAHKKMTEGQHLDPSITYLEKFKGKTDEMTFNGSLDIDALLFMLEYVSYSTLRYGCERMARTSQDPTQAFNRSTVALSEAAWGYADVVIYRAFVSKVKELEKISKATYTVLYALCMIYGIHEVIQHADVLLVDRYMTKEHLHVMKDKLLSLYTDIRPDAVALVDAFDHDDRTLHSVLGRYDGDVYAKLLDWSKNTPLNTAEIQEAVRDHLEPLKQSRL